MYFADGKTRSCKTTCPTASWNTFADPATQTCLLVCPTGYFRDRTAPAAGVCTTACTTPLLADPTTGDCVAECPSPLLAETGTLTCVQDCPDGSYANVSAKKCFPSCDSSLGYWANNYSFVCVGTCPATPPLFAYDTSHLCVEMCPDTPSLFGNEATRTCVAAASCQATYYADPLSRLCVDRCSAAYALYGENSTNLCQAACSTGFADNETQVCVTRCPASLHYYGSNLKCVKECPAGQTKDNATQTCVGTCPASSYRDPTSLYCVAACPYAYYADDRAGVNACVLACPAAPLLYADEASKKCVPMCPLANGTYGVVVAGSPLCVAPCPDGLFANNGSRTCLATCAAGFKDSELRMCVSVCSSAPLLFGDGASGSCVAHCPSSSFSYVDSSMLCVATCPGNYYGDTTTQECVLVCPSGYFRDADNQLCMQACTNSKFQDPSTGNCVAVCPSTPSLFGDTGVTPRACVFNCSSGIYMNNQATRLCEPTCPLSSGKFLDTITRSCVPSCPFGFFADAARVCVTVCPMATPQTFADSTTHLCVQTCPDGYFAESVSKQCLAFCVAGKFADTHTDTCETTCTATSPIEYADPSTRTCVGQCPALPLLYGQSSSQTCVVSCANANEYAKDSTRTCVAPVDCDPQFADPSTKKCVAQCPFAYSRFSDPTTWTCSATCPGTLNADSSTMSCVELCPLVPRLFAHSNICKPNCLGTGLFGDPVTRKCSAACTFVAPNFYYRDASTSFCVRLCPANSFADNASRSCVGSCPTNTFADNSTWRCVQDCPASPSLFADSSTLVCVFQCPGGFFADPTTHTCVQSCPLDPRYYRYSPLRICTQLCPFPYGKQDSSGNCVTECANGMYLNITQNKCVVCHVQCTTCNALLACTSCVAGFFLSLGSCSVRCSANPPLYADSVSQSCVAACTQGYFGLDSSRACVTACPVQFYGDAALGRCVACPAGCVTCGGSNCFTCETNYVHSAQTLTCKRTCSATRTFYYQEGCYAACPAGSYLLPDEVNCQTCAQACVTCRTLASNCTLCLNAFLYNGRCVTLCPSDHFSSQGVCLACTANPQACLLPPLTYTVTPFFQNYQLYAYLVFNREVFIQAENIRDIVEVRLTGISQADFTYSIERHNSTSYRLQIITTSNVNLNENALSVTFDPIQITDVNGQQLSMSESEAVLPQGISSSTQELETGTRVENTVSAGFYALAALAVLAVLVKSYVALVLVEVAQIVWMHNYVNLSIGFLYNMVVGKISYIDFNWVPNPLALLIPENYTSPGTPVVYEQSTSDLTFFRNVGGFLVLLAVFAVATLAALLLRWQGVSKPVRQFAEKWLVPRVQWSLLLYEGLSYIYMPVVFFGAYQFVVLDLSAAWLYANLVVAAMSLLALLGGTFYVCYLAYKHAARPLDTPAEFDFLVMEPTSAMELPLRLLRRLLLAALLVPAVYSVQIFGMLAVNVAFLALLIYLQNSALNKLRYGKAERLGWTYTEYLVNKILVRCIELAIIVYEVLILVLNKTSSTYFVVGAVLPLLVAVGWLLWRGWLALRPYLVPCFPSLAASDDELTTEKVAPLDGLKKEQFREVPDEEHSEFRKTGQSFNLVGPGSIDDVPPAEDDDSESVRSD